MRRVSALEQRVAGIPSDTVPDPEWLKQTRTEALGVWRDIALYEVRFAGNPKEDPRFIESIARFRDAITVLGEPTVSARVTMKLAYAHDRHGRSQTALEILASAIEDESFAATADFPTLLLEAARVAVRVGPTQYANAVRWLDRVAMDHASAIDTRFEVALAYYGVRVELATAFGNLDQIATWQRIERATLAQYISTLEQSGSAALIDHTHVIRERTHAVQAALALARDDEAIAIVDELLADPMVRQNDSVRRELESRRRVAAVRIQRMKALPADVAARLTELENSADPARLLELRQIAVIALASSDPSTARRCVEVAKIDPDAAPRIGPAGVSEGILLSYQVRFLLSDHAESATVERYIRGVRTRLAAQIDAIRSAPLLEGGAGFLNYPEWRQLLSYCVALELEHDNGEFGKLRVLDWLLSAQATGTLSRSLSLGIPTLAQIRSEMLGDGEGALMILPAGPRGYVVAIDQDSLLLEAIPAESELKSTRQALRTALLTEPRHEEDSFERPVSSAERENARRAGAEFAREFLPPAIQSEIKSWRALVVVGADLVDGFAAEPLLLNGAPQPLGDTHKIRYVPSYALGIHFGRPRPPSKDSSLHLIAATDSPEPGLPVIPFAEEDAREITASFAGSRTSFALGAAAGPAALASPEARAARIWMILAHGSFDPTDPLPAGIYLAKNDGAPGALRFGPRDVRGLSVPEIILLAACGTQRGPQRKGDDGPQHLVGAFVKAGARSVVASRGDLEYHATRILAREMLKRLAAGDSLGEALRLARIELRKSEQFDHPFYYATWQIVGRG